jgi:outer membrane lipoprotein SlyB
MKFLKLKRALAVCLVIATLILSSCDNSNNTSEDSFESENSSIVQSEESEISTEESSEETSE